MKYTHVKVDGAHFITRSLGMVKTRLNAMCHKCMQDHVLAFDKLEVQGMFYMFSLEYTLKQEE